MKTHLLKSLALAVAFITLMSGCEKKEEDVGPSFQVGQLYGGGIIFYVDETGEHGYICAPHDQSAGIAWHKAATERDYGDGKANTDKIIAAQRDGTYAAKLCKDLVLNGYSDWYLPSMSEAFRMYFNLHSVKGIGDFADGENTGVLPNGALTRLSRNGAKTAICRKADTSKTQPAG